MSLWSLFYFGKRVEDRIDDVVATGETPVISSSKELDTYLAHKIDDAEFAKVFVAIMDKTGEEVAIAIKKGGDGDPYQVEYVKSKSFKKMTKREVKKCKQQIIDQLERNRSLSHNDADILQSELAELAEDHIVIWVNSPTEEEFRMKEDLFTKAMDATRELFGK